MNIAAAPALAERLNIQLDTVTSRQVPSLIMFQAGAEVGRIPSVRARALGFTRPRVRD